MNIFVLSKNPRRAAQLHTDKHVVKMVLETAQILSTVMDGPYKPTHVHHPAVVWAGEHPSNLYWTWRLGVELCKEYTKRYGKKHGCEDVIHSLKPAWAARPTYWVQCMPDEYKDECPVRAYHKYYRAEKSHMKGGLIGD